MLRQIVVPTQNFFTLQLPSEYIGKQVEVIAFEVNENTDVVSKKKTTKNAIKQMAGAFPNVLSLEEIRKKAWPVK